MISFGGILLEYLIVFFLVFLYKTLNLIKYSFPWAGDSILTIAGGMYFAGYDWSKFAAGNSYYGFLFPMLLSPLMRFIDDPVLLYKSMLGVSDLVMALNVTILYYIMRKRLLVDRYYSSIICIAFITYEPVAIFSDFILSEVPLMTWILAETLLLLSLLSGTNIRFKSAIFSILMPLGILIHARCLIVWVSFFFVIALYRIVYKEALLWYPSLILIIPQYIICKACKVVPEDGTNQI